MKFAILLRLLEFLLRFAVWRYPDIKKRVAKTRTSICIRTQDKKVGRCYFFENGKVYGRKICTSPDAALVWKDARTAFLCMAAGYDGKVALALQHKDVVVQGDAERIFWFFSTIREIKDSVR